MWVKSLAVDGLKLVIKTFAAEDILPDVLMCALQAIYQRLWSARLRQFSKFTVPRALSQAYLYRTSNRAKIFANMA
jgi:hypothetical protein